MTTRDYPEMLPDDNTIFWENERIFNRTPFYLVKCYYHNTEKIPINMHSHIFYEINIVTKGNGRHYLNEHNYSAHEGCVFVIPPYVRHGYWAKGNMEIFHILLHKDFMIRYSNELANLSGFVLLFEIEPFIRLCSNEDMFLKLDGERIEKLKEELEDLDFLQKCDYPGKEIMKISKTLYVLATLSNYISREQFRKLESPADSYTVAVMRCMEYIYQNMGEKLYIDSLCSMFNMSRSCLFRSFKKICRMTPIQYQLKCRIDKARFLLEFTDNPIQDIALECGFFDCSHFSKVFKNEVGDIPTKYRDKCRKSSTTDDHSYRMECSV